MPSTQCYVSGCYIKFSLNKACPYHSWENGHILPAEKNMTKRTWGGGRLRRQTTKKVLVFEGVRKSGRRMQASRLKPMV